MARGLTSWSLFRFKGIPVRVHWSFPLLIAWVAGSAVLEGLAPRHVLAQVLYVLVLFACVVLHEFGHALTALRYGIRTRDITLFPIGGVASLERLPEKPAQELAVALAGPAVNLVIALLLGVALLISGGPWPVLENGQLRHDLASLPAVVALGNLALLFFNLVPAFPMDGGRVLRALLAMRMDRVRATQLAARMGRVIAFGFILAAFWWKQPMLGLIGVFVILAAGQERRAVETQDALRGVRVREVFRTRYWNMPAEATIQDAATELLAVGDHVLMLTREGAYLKSVPRSELIAAVQAGRQSEAVEALPGVVLHTVGVNDVVNEAMREMMSDGIAVLPVVENGLLVGALELDNITEFLAMRGVGREEPVV